MGQTKREVYFPTTRGSACDPTPAAVTTVWREMYDSLGWSSLVPRAPVSVGYKQTNKQTNKQFWPRLMQPSPLPCRTHFQSCRSCAADVILVECKFNLWVRMLDPWAEGHRIETHSSRNSILLTFENTLQFIIIIIFYGNNPLLKYRFCLSYICWT